MKQNGKKSYYHPDIWIFLLAIPLISAFNYYLTYSHIRLNGFLVLSFTIDTVQGYLAWLAVRAIIVYLDGRLSYSPNPVRRIVIQVLLTTACGVFLIAATTELVSWIARGRPAARNFYTLDILIISIWFLVINGVYVGIHLYRQWQYAEQGKKSGPEEQGGLGVKSGNQHRLVKFEEIGMFHVDAEYVQLITRDNRKFLLDDSLDKLEKKIPPEVFFRLNRQCIVHRQLVSGYRRIENGKIQVLLTPSIDRPAEMIVSRTKAPAFKRWFLPQS